MFCPNCGKQMSDRAIFCGNCGWLRNGENVKQGKRSGLPIQSIVATILIVLLLVALIVVIKEKGFNGKAKEVAHVKNGWNGDYYYVDNQKIMNDWIEHGNQWYYLKEDGKRVTNDWKKIGSDYYYFDSSGVMQQNTWIDNEYYVGDDGKMLMNTVTPDGYMVGPDGKYIRLNFDSKLVKIYNEINSNPQYYYGAHDYLGLPHSCYSRAKFNIDGNLWLSGGAGGGRDGWACIDIISPTGVFDSYYDEWGWLGNVHKHNNMNVSNDVIQSIFNQFDNLVDAYKGN